MYIEQGMLSGKRIGKLVQWEDGKLMRTRVEKGSADFVAERSQNVRGRRVVGGDACLHLGSLLVRWQKIEPWQAVLRTGGSCHFDLQQLAESSHSVQIEG